MRIFAIVGLSRTAIFSVFAGYSFGYFRDKANVIISWYEVRIVGFSVIPKCMTLNDLEWLFHVKLSSRRFGWLRPCNIRKIIA